MEAKIEFADEVSDVPLCGHCDPIVRNSSMENAGRGAALKQTRVPSFIISSVNVGHCLDAFWDARRGEMAVSPPAGTIDHLFPGPSPRCLGGLLTGS